MQLKGVLVMNKKDLRAFDAMIKEAWNTDNMFCRRMKEFIGRHFDYVPELVERCEDPYWRNR
jgi:hypothetical protein